MFGELGQTVVGVPIWEIALLAVGVGLLGLEHEMDADNLDDKVAEVTVTLLTELKPIAASVLRGIGVSVFVSAQAAANAISRILGAINEHVNVEITIEFLIQITPRRALLGLGLLTGVISLGVIWPLPLGV